MLDVKPELQYFLNEIVTVFETLLTISYIGGLEELH